MRLTDEKIADVKEYLARSMKVTASSLIPQLSKYGLDLIDTIEALQQENNGWRERYDELDAGHSRLFKDFCKLQQENEQLRAQLDEWKYEAKCHMDEVVARDKEIEKLRAHVARMRDALQYYADVKRWGTVEDSGLSPEEVQELAKAKADGRLVVLPCKTEDTVFIVYAKKILETTVDKRAWTDDDGYMLRTKEEWFKEKDIGKTVFLTREAAEKALGGVSDGH